MGEHLSGFLRYLGFALPLSVVLNGPGGSSDGSRDGHPSPVLRCAKCARGHRESYVRWDGKRVCGPCVSDTTFTLRRVNTFGPRRLDLPQEEVADAPHKQIALDPWWESQFA